MHVSIHVAYVHTPGLPRLSDSQYDKNACLQVSFAAQKLLRLDCQDISEAISAGPTASLARFVGS